jgi:hypothetical protein
LSLSFSLVVLSSFIISGFIFSFLTLGLSLF